MSFLTIDKTKKSQKLILLNPREYEITGTFTLKGSKILDIELNMQTDFSFSFHSAFLCENTLTKGSYFLVINLVSEVNVKKRKIDVELRGDFKIITDRLIFTKTNRITLTNTMINDCNYDPLGTEHNPLDDNGNIIVGRP